MEPKDSTVVLRAHRIDDAMLGLLAKLRLDLGDDRVYVLFDDTRGGWAKGGGDDVEGLASRTLRVTDAECLALNSMHDQGYGHDAASWSFWHPETSFVMMHDWLRLRSEAASVDRVWFIEYDVRCHGSFADALAVCDAKACDFMACAGGEGQKGDALRTARADPGWCWWCRVDGAIAERVPTEDRVGCFFPMVRISSALVEALRAEFGKSTGFCEVYVPTLCATTPGLVASAIPGAALADFRYSPTIPQATWDAFERDGPAPAGSQFYHPITANAIENGTP